MNRDTNNHKPLSREELLRLLETKDEHTLPESDMDDFEKEALEGFSKHSSAAKAQKLIAEVDLLINEKLNEKKRPAPVSTMVWFSAAASVLLIVILSIYFLTQTTGPLDSDLAINTKTTEEMEKQVGAPAESLSEKGDNEAVKAASVEQNLKQELSTIKVNSSMDQKGIGATTDEYNYNVNSENKKGDAIQYNLEAVKDDTKDGDKNRSDRQSKSIATEQLNATQAPPALVEDLKVATTAQVAVMSSKASEKEDQTIQNKNIEKAAKEQIVETNQIAAKNVAPKKQPQRSKATEESDAQATNGSAAQTYKQTPVVAGEAASFPGGETAVKAYILGWLKNNNKAPEQLSGLYIVKLKVLANGTANVLEIKPDRNDNVEMVSSVKKALNSMKGWNPARMNNTSVESELEMHLVFPFE